MCAKRSQPYGYVNTFFRFCGFPSARIVSDSALTTRINPVRCASGGTGAEQRLIKTLARKGPCFVGAMREQPKAETVTVVAYGEAAT
jgi:hypothetical protein